MLIVKSQLKEIHPQDLTAQKALGRAWPEVHVETVHRAFQLKFVTNTPQAAAQHSTKHLQILPWNEHGFSGWAASPHSTTLDGTHSCCANRYMYTHMPYTERTSEDF